MASLLDYLLMKGLVESLEGQTEEDDEGKEEEKEESHPDNYFTVVDLKAWKKAQESCKREKMVVAMEITNPFDDNCRRMRHLFLRTAKEFDSIPFLSVVTGPGRQLTMEQICRDVGQVRQLPAILLLYYDAVDHIKRKSYQGETAIQEVLKDGRLKQKVKELIDERLQQKEMESLQAAEMEYSERLKKMRKNLSEDKLPKPRTRFDSTTESIDLGTLEEHEDEKDMDETDSEANNKHQNQGIRGEDESDSRVSTCATATAPDEAKLAAKHVIDVDQITVGERIGQGGFGVVYEAKWNDKCVAVKVCSGNLIKHFPREVEILASLPPHPNVMAFFGLALSKDEISTLLVTELATNGSLFNYLHVKKEVPPDDQRLAWALHVASGMAHLHSHNVIHRDLKSGNILLSFGMMAKVCDFGTARPLAQTTKQSNVAGTYRWMSPEVMEDVEANINNKCDVFSYGMVLYEIFALKVPYADLADARVSGVVLEGKRPPIPDELPLFLSPLLQRCWEHDPKRRPGFNAIALAIQTKSFKDEN